MMADLLAYVFERKDNTVGISEDNVGYQHHLLFRKYIKLFSFSGLLKHAVYI